MSYDQLIKRNWKPRPNRRPCCNDRNNMSYAFDLNNQKDKVALKCKKCNAVHYYSLNETGSYAKRFSNA